MLRWVEWKWSMWANMLRLLRTASFVIWSAQQASFSLALHARRTGDWGDQRLEGLFLQSQHAGGSLLCCHYLEYGGLRVVAGGLSEVYLVRWAPQSPHFRSQRGPCRRQRWSRVVASWETVIINKKSTKIPKSQLSLLRVNSYISRGNRNRRRSRLQRNLNRRSSQQFKLKRRWRISSCQLQWQGNFAGTR